MLTNWVEKLQGEMDQSKDQALSVVVKTITSLIPLYLFSMTASLDVQMDVQGVSEMLKLPDAEMLNITAHDYLYGVSQYSTTDDLELI